MTEASARLRGRGRLLGERSQNGPSEANGANARLRFDQPPLQGANSSAGAPAARAQGGAAHFRTRKEYFLPRKRVSAPIIARVP